MSSVSSTTGARSASTSGAKKNRLVTGPWKLSDLEAVPSNGLKVFSCFHCGGGSTMGYKLAGYNVLGGVEIDPEMMEIYRRNFSPRLSYLEDIRNFATRKDLPSELSELDVLDGSPPCSSFSMSGNREKDWGKKKKLREGQADQVLDDLFFDFVSLAKRLRPKVVVAENVKGMLIGKARGYTKQILTAFREAGYHPQVYLLNSSRMGVPQARERLFFVARRADLDWQGLFLSFAEQPIAPREAFNGIDPVGKRIGGKKTLSDWRRTAPGAGFGTVDGYNSHKKLSPVKVSFTQTASLRHYHWSEPAVISNAACARLQTFPEDYDFMKSDPGYVCGMSVPP